MLEIFNTLKPFFEDNYVELSVREYARSINVSPPTASKLLEKFHKKGILNKHKERIYKLYSANRNNWLFLALLRIYWEYKIRDSGLIEYLENHLVYPIVILFGSSIKGELRKESDIDIAIFTIAKKDIEIEIFEERIGRNLHILMFKNKKEVKNENLLLNILNGYKIIGEWYEIMD